MNRFPYVFFGCQKVVLFANLFQSPSPGYLPYLPGPTLSPTSLVSTVVVKNKRVNLLRGRCQTMVFYNPGKLPQKFHCSKVRFLGSRARSSKTRGRSSHRSYAVFFLIYAYPMDISRLKSGIWRTPPTPHLEAQKTCGGWYISCGQVKYFSVFFVLSPTNIPGLKGGGSFRLFMGQDNKQNLAFGDTNPSHTWCFIVISPFLAIYLTCSRRFCRQVSGKAGIGAAETTSSAK